ncbi:hypothetical protein [Halalkalibacter oceani]
MKDDVLKTAFQGWDQLSATEEEVLAYEARLKQVLDEEAAKREAELREQEALQKGLEQGKREGERERLIRSTVNFLEARFPEEDKGTILERLNAMTDIEELDQRQKEVFRAESWAEVKRIL